MTRDEFIKGYCERSSVTWEELSKWLVAIQCDCGDETCNAWQMRSRRSIAEDAAMPAAAPLPP